MIPEPQERQPFDMDCLRCEYEPVCFIPLKVAHKLTRKWYQLCKQGRKRKVIKQCTIAEAIAKCEARHPKEAV